MLSHDLLYKGTVQLPEPAKQISPEQLKLEVNLCSRLNVLSRLDPVQFLPLLFFIARFRDIIFKKSLRAFVFLFFLSKTFLPSHPLPSHLPPAFVFLYVTKLTNAMIFRGKCGGF
jgi:hypothetical protein